jgi:hypothetical protein
MTGRPVPVLVAVAVAVLVLVLAVGDETSADTSTLVSAMSQD